MVPGQVRRDFALVQAERESLASILVDDLP